MKDSLDSPDSKDSLDSLDSTDSKDSLDPTDSTDSLDSKDSKGIEQTRQTTGMNRISASSYSNTAPLIWSFLYGSMHGKAEVILDNAPARSAELLSQGRVDAALVPVISFQTLEGARLLGDVCVGAESRVRSVCLVTNGPGLKSARSVALDVSSKTSVALTKVIFREFLGLDPVWISAEPDPEKMLARADCALLIGDPALILSAGNIRSGEAAGYRVFDLAELWHKHTGLGFVFAAWMAGGKIPAIDFAAARDEGLAHIDDIIANYLDEIPLSREDFRTYLTENISYRASDRMREGMELFFDLCLKHGIIDSVRPVAFAAA